MCPSAREVVVAEPGLSGEERIGHPPVDERWKVPLDELGELVVCARPSSTFVGVGEAGRGADEGQRPHSLRVSARCGERDPAPHRVADEVTPVTGERQHCVGHGVDGVVGGVGRVRPGSVAGEIGHERRRVDQVGECSHRRPIAGKAVEDDDAHPLIASPTAVVMERRTAMS